MDHLITPELGGSSDARNLWPQPYSQTPWNAYVKDELERLFHRLVCRGEIALATAQRAMTTDWISAYKQYFNTDKPLRDYDRAPLTVLDSELLLGELEELGVSPPVRATGPALMAMLQLQGWNHSRVGFRREDNAERGMFRGARLVLQACTGQVEQHD